MIKQVNGYKAISHTKGPLSKKPKSKQSAIKQLYAIFKSKQRKGDLPKGRRFSFKEM